MCLLHLDRKLQLPIFLHHHPDSNKFQARFADLEGKLKTERVLDTKLENDLKIEHGLVLKHSFGNA